MIPLKLHIKNFLSYGSPTQIIDFMPYHLICLSGKNGHGKSALLDALTWAVWGQARKGLGTTKADEGLIRLGQTHMVVALDFTCNGQNYRVRREFTCERGKGVTQLDFGILDIASGTMHELTDKTIRATQAKIEQTIGFDYESFINSVFLRQGNSNEFSKKSPKERKEVLANILGLAKYELLRKQALDKVREGTIAAQHLAKNCELLTAETAHGAEYREQLAQLTTHAIHLLAQEQQCNEQLHAHGATKKTFQEQLHTHQQTLFMHEQIAKTVHTHEQTLCELVQTWRTTARILRTAQHQPLDEARKKELDQEVESIQKKINKRLALTQEMMLHSAQLQTIKSRMQEQQHEQQQQQLQHCHALETKLHVIKTELLASTTALKEVAAQQAQLIAELEQITQETTTFKQQAEMLAREETLFERRKTLYHTWVNRGNKYALELKKVTAQLQQLTNADTACCPLCEQDLAPARLATLQAKLHAQERRLTYQLQRLKRLLPQLKEILTQQHQLIAQHKETITHLTQRTHRAEEITKQLEQLARARTNKETLLNQQTEALEQDRAELERAQKQKNILMIPLDALLLGNDEYRSVHYKIKTCEQALTECTYDQQRYETLQQLIATFVTQQNKQHEIVQQTALQEKRKQDIHDLCKSIRRMRTEHAILSEALPRSEELKKNIAELERCEQMIAHEKQAIIEQKEAIAHQRGSLEQRCLRIAHQEVSLKKEQEELNRIEHDTQEYHILAQALSKDGVQGLLIENVIPEIETEANDLLARLTNNQAQLSIESIRDLKSGGTKETLEIKIADAVGVRPYELFSGGEAFRIDFALRLAVSKLLARRTGTSLQTLIIDEGFGSQDEEGLNHIMEALYSIQEDFAKIIIVSHLPTMKDQFPVHFTIQKTPRGSTVQVIEQG